MTAIAGELLKWTVKELFILLTEAGLWLSEIMIFIFMNCKLRDLSDIINKNCLESYARKRSDIMTNIYVTKIKR